MKQPLFVLSATLFCSTVFAQTAPNLPALTGATTSARGILPLPDGVERVVAIDAQNSILAQMSPQIGEPRRYSLIQVKHVYVGGIAMLFNGGSIVPTGPFVSPGFAQGGQFGGQNGNSGGQNNNFGGGIGQGQLGQQNNGFFPQNGFGNQQSGLQLTPNGGRTQASPQNQPGLTIGTPLGKFFVPGSVTN